MADQLDLLSWEPPELVARFEDISVRASTLRARIALAVSTTMKESPKSRARIALEMSAWLDEDISENMLNAYASQGREEHTIPYLRLLALIQVTDDTRLLHLGAELFGHAVIDDRYLGWVEVGQLSDKKQDVDAAFDAARRNARRRPRR